MPTATKKITKTAAPKTKVIAKKSGAPLVIAYGEQQFWTTDGRILKDLLELRDALSAMEKHVFDHHVTGEKNDFADWVEFVLQDTSGASMLRSKKTPSAAATSLKAHIKKVHA